MRSTPRALLLLANRRGPYRVPDVVAAIAIMSGPHTSRVN